MNRKNGGEAMSPAAVRLILAQRSSVFYVLRICGLIWGNDKVCGLILMVGVAKYGFFKHGYAVGAEDRTEYPNHSKSNGFLKRKT